MSAAPAARGPKRPHSAADASLDQVGASAALQHQATRPDTKRLRSSMNHTLKAHNSSVPGREPELRRSACDSSYASESCRRPSDGAEDLQHMRHREAQLKADVNGFQRSQPIVRVDMRLVLVEWLSEVHQDLHDANLETFFLTVDFLDRFLCSTSVSKDEFQLLGLTCLWVAAKYEEIYPPTAKELLAMAADAWKPEQMVQMERKLLATLNYELSPPTALRFLHYYLWKANICSGTIMRLAECLLELSLLDIRHLHALPSEAAAAALLAALSLTSCESFTPVVTALANCKDAQALGVLAQTMLHTYQVVLKVGRPCSMMTRFQKRQAKAAQLVKARAAAAAAACGPSSAAAAAQVAAGAAAGAQGAAAASAGVAPGDAQCTAAPVLQPQPQQKQQQARQGPKPSALGPHSSTKSSTSSTSTGFAFCAVDAIHREDSVEVAPEPPSLSKCYITGVQK